MCFYRGTLYLCKHSECGKKVTNCADQQDFLAGKSKRKCTRQQVHSMNRVRAASKCARCQRLDVLKERAQKTLKDLRENMDKLQDSSKKEDNLTDESKDQAVHESENQSLDDVSEEKQNAVGAPKDSDASFYI
ncbi:hypothetical protein CCHL11_02918 [Colletotrichum chlorophyti]|uniref:Uncharacterized protein n=1 Tax=Colletotrichum chlorophyti TaxID=708187 RepID=A0A1Q8S0X4_9PEZI|nr:hypothetical protein CCHL11_02918 [Colletotrichum chlorophyti]